jgi:hypothetical protein
VRIETRHDFTVERKQTTPHRIEKDFPMPTLTIELTETAYREAIALSESERSRIASNAFAIARNAPSDEEPTSEEDIIAIGEAFADLDAGRVIDGDTVFANLRARRAARQAAGNATH